MSDIEEYRVLIIDDNQLIHEDIRKVLAPPNQEANIEMFKMYDELFQEKESKSESNEILAFPKFILDSVYQGQDSIEYINKSLSEKRPYAIAFVDVRMPPGWDGIETIKHIWEIDNLIQVVICTAFSDYSWSDTIKQLGQTDRLLVLKKPFDNIELKQIACALSRKWMLRQQLQGQFSNLQDLVKERTIELETALSSTRATLESTTDGILVVSLDWKIVDYNDRFVAIWNVPQSILATRDYKQFIDFASAQFKDPQHFLDRIKELYNRPEERSFDELEFKNGHIIERHTQPQWLNGEVIGRVCSFYDITERKKLEEKLIHQATHDLLTDLPNRILLLDRISQAVLHAKRSQLTLGLLFIDLDQFKNINDSLGHSMGDVLLREVAVRLKNCVREEDTVARLGGDEFIILLANLTDQNQIITVVKKVQAELAKPFIMGGHELMLSSSVGISLYPKDGNDAVELLKNADAAMYRAKELGRDNFQFYTDELNASTLQRIELQNELRGALQKNEFKLQYQPLISLRTGLIIGVEALLRWHNPKRGLIAPEKFIHLAEESGLIVPIGEWVLRTACQQAKTWQVMGIAPIRMSVNLSGRQIQRENIKETVARVLAEANFDPNYLELELTESVLMENIEETIKKMKELKDLGISLVIDDFGTGFSSLSYLKRFPVSKLKIDKSFIIDMDKNSEDIQIICAIIGMAKNLKLQVLAEGVEVENQLEFLYKQGCDEVQGFLFSVPLDATACEQLLKTPVRYEAIQKLQNHS